MRSARSMMRSICEVSFFHCETEEAMPLMPMGISGIASSVSQWKNETSQIDLIIDRADRIVNLCEMKFSNAPFEITKAYAERLRNRMADFCVATKCKKGISNTFVTTYGVKQGKHSSIVNNQVLLDDLFN